jgi:hypothetical protein
VDHALVDGESAPAIAAKYRGITDDAVRRHRESHLPQTLAKATAAAEVGRADTLLHQVQDLLARARGILDAAEGAGDLRTALGGIREARGCLELLGRLEGELQDTPTVNVILSAEWSTLKGLIVTTLRPYPAAQRALAAALEPYAGG